jgi:hypothetical protein
LAQKAMRFLADIAPFKTALPARIRLPLADQLSSFTALPFYSTGFPNLLQKKSSLFLIDCKRVCQSVPEMRTVN